MPMCNYVKNETTYYPESYPNDRVILLTSKIIPANRTDIQHAIYEDQEPLIGKGGPQHVTYSGIMTDDAYFELYEKKGESLDEGLGTLVWRFGRVPFEKGQASLAMQGDGNLVIYSGGQEENQAAVFPGYWDQNLPRIWSSSEGYENYLPYSPEEYKVFNPCLRTSSALSLIGSLLVLYMIVGQRIKQKKWNNTRDRILVGVCILDLFFTVGLGIGTAATPPDFHGVVGAMGNVRFCEAQGFMIQLGMAVPLYYCGLSLVFLLYVIKGKRTRVVTRWVEPITHVMVWTVALSTAVAGLVLELYNSNGQFCYIEPYPYSCETEYIDCLRGEEGNTLIWFFGAGLVALPYLGTTILMIALYFAVWHQDRKLRKRYGDLWNGNMDRLKKIKIQAVLYIGGFFLVWIWNGIRLLLEMLRIESPFWLDTVATFAMPLQGFFNFMIFVRQPIARTHKDHPERSFIWVVLSAIKDYPFTETEQQRRNANRRRSSFGPRASTQFVMKALTENGRRLSEDSTMGESGTFIVNSRFFVLKRGKDQEGAC